jgi:phosphatidylserine/phosphatidylglycerophosphate/cardiolipin synthase-like enzyme
MQPRAWIGRLAQALVAALLCLCTVGCSTASIKTAPKAASQTLSAGPDAALTQISTALLAPIKLAQSSVDIQVYIWRNDKLGRGLAAAVWLAASRGVRLLVDDWGAGLPDALLAQLDQHPNRRAAVQPAGLAPSALAQRIAQFQPDQPAHAQHGDGG